MELYVSSGAFTGRINGRNPRLLADYWDQFDCDGFELMLFDDLEPQMDSIIELYQKARVPIRVLHADKRTGDWMGNLDPGAQQKLLDLFERNCRVGNALGAQKIVIGLPKNMNGTEGPAAEKCRAFGEMLGKFLDIEQVYSDERLTTVQAQRTLIGANVSRKKRKNVVDKLAAQLILQNYLDAQGVMR